MDEAPKRFKEQEQFTPSDWESYAEAKRRGDPTQIENPEWTEAKRKHMEAGGFGDEDAGKAGVPPDRTDYSGLSQEELDALSPEQHEQIERNRR